MEIGRGFEAQENRSLFQTIHKGKMNKEAVCNIPYIHKIAKMI